MALITAFEPTGIPLIPHQPGVIGSPRWIAYLDSLDSECFLEHIWDLDWHLEAYNPDAILPWCDLGSWVLIAKTADSPCM
jgi:hypothetical protein